MQGPKSAVFLGGGEGGGGLTGAVRMSHAVCRSLLKFLVICPPYLHLICVVLIVQGTSGRSLPLPLPKASSVMPPPCRVASKLCLYISYVSADALQSQLTVCFSSSTMVEYTPYGMITVAAQGTGSVLPRNITRTGAVELSYSLLS